LVLQLTAAFVEPVTVAVNCWVPAEETVAVAGEIETVTVGGGAGALTVTAAVADMAVLAWLVALTVTFILEVHFGAVNIPEVEIEPDEADQVTVVLLDPVTVAVNC
jgi:DNA primase